MHTRYQLVRDNSEWVVVEHSRHGEAVRGRYPTEAEARARIAQLAAQNTNLRSEEIK